MLHNMINSFHLEDIKNQDHPSIFVQDEKYDLFILRLLQIEDEKVVPISQAFIITEDRYYHYDETKNSFNDLGSIEGFYKFLDRDIDVTMKIVSSYFEKIEHIEDSFYNGEIERIKRFNKQWFLFKNDLVRINRVLFKGIEAMGDLIHLYKKEDDYLKRHFEDIDEHLKRAHRNSGLLLEKLDALYNFYLTQNNEQMNHTVYILTILSGIFLPLNFIVGFFGMNTTSMFFTQAQGGTYSVLFVLVGVALISTFLIYFLKKR